MKNYQCLVINHFNDMKSMIFGSTESATNGGNTIAGPGGHTYCSK